MGGAGVSVKMALSVTKPVCEGSLTRFNEHTLDVSNSVNILSMI